MSFNDLVFRIIKQEKDPRNLGRWCSFSFAGKNKTITTIIMCYCPVKGTSVGGAYAQHLIYMSDHKDSIPPTSCPRQLFGLDLKVFVQGKVNQGHNVIVMGDFNSNYKHLTKWMGEIGLIDLIAHKHGVCPTTHLRSKIDPIDCIFGSPSLHIASGGFLPYHKLISDHRGIWIDIPKFLIYGYNLSLIHI